MKKKKIVRPLIPRANKPEQRFKPDTFIAAGKKVLCPHCKCDVFATEQALLNTRAATFFKLDWLDKSGTALICKDCGLIQWFRNAPERILPS